MKNRRYEHISESEESDEERQSSTKIINANDKDDTSSDFSSEPEERARPSTPPVRKSVQKKTSLTPQKVPLNPLEKFVAANEGLTKLTIQDVISKEDDVCLLELPKSLDPNQFLEKTINFDRKTKVKLGKTKYIIEPEVDTRPINVLTEKLKIIRPVSVLKLREYKKHRSETEAVSNSTEPPALPNNLKVRHPLFGSEYKRKILLNEEIQRKLDNVLDKAVKKMKKKKQQKQIDEPSFSDSGKKKKQKKKVDVRVKNENDDYVEEPIFSLLNTHIGGSKKKKASFYEEPSYTNINGVSNDTSEQEENLSKMNETLSESFHLESKKKKRKNVKQEWDVQDVSELQLNSNEASTSKTERKKKHKTDKDTPKENFTSQDLPDSYLGSSGKEKNEKTKKIKREKEPEFGLSFTDNDFEGEKKKKKRLHKIKEEVFSQDELEEDRSLIKKEKKRASSVVRDNLGMEEASRRRSIVNSTVIPDLQLPLFEFDVSQIVGKDTIHNTSTEKSPKKKKDKSLDFESENESKSKKRIKQESETTEESAGEIKHKKRKYEAEVEDEISPKKKHKVKKEKHEDDASNSLILNLLNRVKTEMGTSVKKTKKRKSEA